MASWIYIFSKFTPEALLFEALIICLLCSSYAAFWVLKKRKWGVLGQETPAYAVKSYLSQLILDAEQMRIQLFGLLAGTGVDPNIMATLRAAQGAGAGIGAVAGTSPLLAALGVGAGGASAASLTNDPELGAKLAAIEAKMIEQARAMETITIEKTRVEKELIEARAGKGGGGSADPAVDKGLADKIKALEAKLAEYSVIEDDLANLKRLQQENTQLKSQLSGKAPAAAAGTPMEAEARLNATATSAAGSDAAADGSVTGPAEVEAAAPASETPTEVPPVVAEATAAAGAEEAQAAAEAVAATSAAVTEAAAAAADPIAAPTADPGFEGLVDQVEQSLADPAAAAAAEPAAGASVADPTAPAAAAEVKEAGALAGATPNSEKTDADLVAEFEKMLNS